MDGGDIQNMMNLLFNLHFLIFHGAQLLGTNQRNAP